MQVTAWSSTPLLWGRAFLSLETADGEVSPLWRHTESPSDTGHGGGVRKGGAAEEDMCWPQAGRTVERAASPAAVLLVNRGYCVARIPAGLPVPSGLGLTNLMTEDAGKCLAEGIWQYLPVLCWGGGGCLQIMWPCLFSAAWGLYYLFLEQGWSLGPWGGGCGQAGEGKSNRWLLTQYQKQAKHPGRAGHCDASSYHLGGEARVPSWACPVPLEKGDNVKDVDASKDEMPCRGAMFFFF